MKISKLGCAMLFFALFYEFSDTVRAEEVVNNQQHSEIEVELLQRPVSLTSVTPPTFGTYELSNRGKTIEATGDLIIDIEDIRAEGSSPWAVQYGISVFKNEVASEQEETEGLVFKVGSGELYINGTKVDQKDYTQQALELSQDKQGILVRMNQSQPATYQYRVPKEKISIQLSKTISKGRYQATQTIDLVNLPAIK